MSSRYPPIDGYAFLSDTHTAALVSPDGAVEWFCVPAFDGGSVFARLLDRDRGGALDLEVAGAEAPERRYLGDTLLLESVYRTGEATVTVTDFLAVADDHDSDRTPTGGSGDADFPISARHLLVRLVRADGGTADVRIGIDARPGYARATARWRPDGDGRWLHEEPRLWAAADRPLRRSGSVLGLETSLGPGEAFAVVLGYADAPPRAVDARWAAELLRGTRTAWEAWSGRGVDIETGREQVRRSALVLRGLMYDRSGALLAAPTTSLPETVGGVRNWDYRFTWHRDAALTVLALYRLGHAEEGARYMRFLLHDCVSGSGRLRPMAGIRGEQEGEETVLDHLEGYAGSRPVRVGNEAFDQLQLDVYGYILDAALSYHQLTGRLRTDEWELLRRYVETVTTLWREPDHGIWEIRGPRRHYVASKVMAWVCLDRGAQLAGLLGDESAPVERWRRTADEVREEVLERGFDRGRNSFVMAYDLPALDAATLGIPLVGFLPGDDPRVLGTIDRMIEELCDGDLMYRYSLSEVDDGLPGEEGAFLLCSFELVSALALAGRVERARELFHRLCRRAGPLGLFSEEMAPDGTALGNYPQAFTHLGLIEAAANLEVSGSREALHQWATGRRQRLTGS